MSFVQLAYPVCFLGCLVLWADEVAGIEAPLKDDKPSIRPVEVSWSFH